MGSESWGNWTQPGVRLNGTTFGTLQGVVTVVDRPAVSWVRASPGFIKTGASPQGGFPDASEVVPGGAGGERNAKIVIEARSWTAYKGFRLAIAAGARFPMYACRGGGMVPFSRGCYKAAFELPSNANKFSRVEIPLQEFTDEWIPAKGGEPRKRCGDGVDSGNCLTASLLAYIQRVEVVAEGESGDVKLDIKSISVQGGGSSTGAEQEKSHVDVSDEETILM